MPLTLLPLTPSDTLSWTRIRNLAYQGPTFDLLHTTRPLPESTIRGVSRMNEREFRNPNFWPWKVVDTDLPPSEDDPADNGGRTVAIALYVLQGSAVEVATKTEGGGKEEEEETFTPPELRLDALGALLGPIIEATKETMGGVEKYLFLRVLATHPEHRKRGAARMLLDVGLKRADEEGLVMALTATEAARGIYERRGFELVKECLFDRKEWGGEGVDWHGCMVRGSR